MAYFVDRTVKMTWWERSYLPAIIKGMYITSRHFFINLFGFVPFFLGLRDRGFLPVSQGGMAKNRDKTGRQPKTTPIQK